MSYVFGRQKRFAVEYDLLNSQSIRDMFRLEPIGQADEAHWLFGHLCLWVAGSRVGDCASVTALTVALATINGQLLRHRGERFDPDLMDRPAARAFQIIDSAIYSSNPPTKDRAHRPADYYYRFVALPDLDVFDHWKAYLVEDQRSARYLWRDPDGNVKEAQLGAGEVDSAFESFVADLEQRTGQKRTV
jgi:Immunity protein 42